jgi:hypothetical protein
LVFIHVSGKNNMKNGMDLWLLEEAKKCVLENLKMVLTFILKAHM